MYRFKRDHCEVGNTYNIDVDKAKRACQVSTTKKNYKVPLVTNNTIEQAEGTNIKPNPNINQYEHAEIVVENEIEEVKQQTEPIMNPILKLLIVQKLKSKIVVAFTKA